ncbi:MAG TPA: methylated-DNA--[protein]-cysteine S-methyltransferase [Candidatus Acidoferrales bacterium]|nr:methylated-DNA--[protein]-cysteine S-methyltransferase [Candidatus Acidoferrales bacterium]
MKSYMYLKTETLGDLLLVATPSHLVGVYFANQHNGPKLSADWKMDPSHPILQQAGKELHEYLAGKRTDFSVPLSNAGTEFQREVWKQIARIPFGKTISYSELAQRVGAPKATRAAGTATGRNPLGIIVPCHRVVGKDGGLGGYAGGLDRKKSLLKIETRV